MSEARTVLAMQLHWRRKHKANLLVRDHAAVSWKPGVSVQPCAAALWRFWEHIVADEVERYGIDEQICPSERNSGCAVESWRFLEGSELLRARLLVAGMARQERRAA